RRVARDRRRRDHVRAAEEVGATRVAEARPARSDRVVLRQPQPGGVERVEERRREPAETVEREGRRPAALGVLPVPVALAPGDRAAGGGERERKAGDRGEDEQLLPGGQS